MSRLQEVAEQLAKVSGMTEEQALQTLSFVRVTDERRNLVPIWPSTLRRCYLLAALARKGGA